jgi:hypothetical protein
MMFLLVSLLHRFTQVLHRVCVTLRNKNNPTPQFLQEFSMTKIDFLRFLQCSKGFFVKVVEGTQSDALRDLRNSLRKH